MLYPTLFNLSVKENLRPRVAFLEEECGLSTKDIASLCIGSRASVFCLSVEQNLKPTIHFLSSLFLGKSDTDKKANIRKLILSHPQALGLSRDILGIKKAYFDAIDALGNDRIWSLASRLHFAVPLCYL